MNVIREAVDAVQRNLAALGVLVVATLVLNTPKIIADLLIVEKYGFETPPDWQIFYELGTSIPMAVGMTVAIVLAFSWMAREIDRPLWKMDGPGDVLRRFGPFWFTIRVIAFLSIILSWQLQLNDAVPALALLCQLAYFALFIFSTPIGAAFMFVGRIRRETIGEALVPLGNQLGKTAIVFFVVLWQFFLFLYVSSVVVHGDDALWQRVLLASALNIILVYLDCLIFAATVLVCKYDRDTHEEVDLDF
jgi:hypothetical protein